MIEGAVSNRDEVEVTVVQYGCHQGSSYAFLQSQIEGGGNHMLIGFPGGAFESGRDALGGDFLGIRVKDGPHRSLARHIPVFHASHAIAENRQEASVSQEG